MEAKSAGFSTLEVLVAFTILSGVIALSMASYSQGLKGLRDAQTQLTAMSLLDNFDFASMENKILTEYSNTDFQIQTQSQSIEEMPLGLLHPKLVTLRVYRKNEKQQPVFEVTTIMIFAEDE